MDAAETALLVIAVQAGDKDALNRLAQHYHKALLRFAYKLCADEQLASDIVQDVWLETSKTLQRLQEPRAFKSWIFRAVRWRCIDQLRRLQREEQYQKEQRQSQGEDLLDNGPPDASNQAVIKFINQLPATEREVLHLFYLEESSVQEVAVILNVPAGTVKSRLNRARNKLKILLEKQYASL